IVSVPWTTTTPSTAGSASASSIAARIANSAGNVKWLAGVRPRSSGTTSASSSRPGTSARMSRPPSTGTLPPAAGSWRMLIVPPVNSTATFAIGSGRSAGVAAEGARLLAAQSRIGRSSGRRDRATGRGLRRCPDVDRRDLGGRDVIVVVLIVVVRPVGQLCAERRRDRVAPTHLDTQGGLGRLQRPADDD